MSDTKPACLESCFVHIKERCREEVPAATEGRVWKLLPCADLGVLFITFKKHGACMMRDRTQEKEMKGNEGDEW